MANNQSKYVQHQVTWKPLCGITWLVLGLGDLGISVFMFPPDYNKKTEVLFPSLT